jgi:hypothetical protein
MDMSNKRRTILLTALLLIMIQTPLSTNVAAQMVNVAILNLEVTLSFSNGEELEVFSGFTWSEPASSVTIKMDITSSECELLNFFMSLDDATVFNVTTNPFSSYQYTVTRETVQDDDTYRLEVFIMGRHTTTSQIYIYNVTGHFSLDRYGIIETQSTQFQLVLVGAVAAMLAVVVVAVVFNRRRRVRLEQIIPYYRPDS